MPVAYARISPEFAAALDHASAAAGVPTAELIRQALAAYLQIDAPVAPPATIRSWPRSRRVLAEAGKPPKTRKTREKS